MNAATQNKNLLAKLLATENITVQHTSGIKTASFNLKTRVLSLPVWHNISNDLLDLLIVHEVGHALDTPKDLYVKAQKDIAFSIFKDAYTDPRILRRIGGFLNVIEDARIDKRQKRRYPGSRRNYLAGYRELIDRDFFGTKGQDINSFNFIDRLNIYFKGGSIHHAIDFSPEEKVLLRKVENQETFADTVALTEEIFRFCKDQLTQTAHNDIGYGSDEEGEEGDDWDSDWTDSYGDSDEDGEYEDANTETDSGEGEEECVESDETNTDGDGEECDGEGDGEESDEEDATSGKGKGDSNDSDDQAEGNTRTSSDGAGSDDHLTDTIPQSHTDSAWEEKSKELVNDGSYQYVYVNLPKYDLKDIVDDFKVVLKDIDHTHANISFDVMKDWHECAREVNAWRSQEKQTISFMVKEFEQRKAAELYSRQQTARTGVINTNKLHTYKYNDDIFRRITTIPKGKNHGFVMFLDWSGSMNPNLKETVKQLFSLVLFCKQIQVPFEVYAFKDCGHNLVDPWEYEGLQNVYRLGSFRLRNFLSSRMNAAELNKAFTFLWAVSKRMHWFGRDGLSGTPLNEALMVAPEIIANFQAKTKVEIVNAIVLTDGEGTPSTGLANYSDANTYRAKYFYTDPVTKKTYDFPNPFSMSSTAKITALLVEIIKDRTNANTVGFFLSSEGYTRTAERFHFRWGDPAFFEKQKKFFHENRFVSIKSEGYDDYYVIDVFSLNTDKQKLVIDTKATNRAIAKTFSKFAAAKTINRVLLRNFIDRISGQHQKAS